MKRDTHINGFGKRLAYIRKSKGLTQKELGEMIGVSNRVIAYYERETKYPPSHLIVPLAEALSVSTDELLGIKETQTDSEPQNAALWRKLKIVKSLPKTDQRAILHYINLIVKNRKIDQKNHGSP